MTPIPIATLLLCAASAALSQNVILTNDDGWAVAQIRAQFNALNAAGFNVRVSAFHNNQGSLDNLHTSRPSCQHPHFRNRVLGLLPPLRLLSISLANSTPALPVHLLQVSTHLIVSVLSKLSRFMRSSLN